MVSSPPAPLFSWQSRHHRFCIRPGHPRDVPDLADLLIAAFHGDTFHQKWFYPILLLGVREDIRQRFQGSPSRQTFLVAEELECSDSNVAPGSLRGVVEMEIRRVLPWDLALRRWLPAHQSQYLYVSNLAVLGASRRLGIGGHLLNLCDATARRWGYGHLALHVMAHNYPAHQLYDRHGYHLLTQQSPWYSALSSSQRRSPDRLLLVKSLSP